MGPGTHGSTFGGNPLAMSVGNAVLDQILKKGFLKNVQSIGHYFYNQLNQLQSEFPDIIKEVRGLGLLVGIKVKPDQNLFVKKLLANKLLTIRAAENVVRLLPPLNVKKENIDQAIVILRKVCKSFK
jgi:acetylornithine/N-succinyldiaminopimelate aminotransferase